MQTDDLHASVGRQYRVNAIRHGRAHERVACYMRGLTPGAVVQLLQISPMGDPLIIWVDGQKMAINRALWQQLELEVVACG